ncbi:MAG: hypothetical protein AB7O37_18500 [Vicinamibacteria bacterium]
MSRFRALAALCLGLVLADAALPLVGIAVAKDSGAYCCAAGRCCCKQGEGEDDENGCLRRACGCGRPDGGTLPSLLRGEALLPAAGRLGGPEPARGAPARAESRLLARPQEPSVPPPKPPLPA